jgi:hypothetical protein
VSGRNGPFRRSLFEALRREAADLRVSPRTDRPLLGSSNLLRGGLSRSSSTLLDVGCGPGLCPGRHDRASPGSCDPGHAPLKPIPSSVPRVLSPVRLCGRTDSHEVPGPCDDFTRASPTGLRAVRSRRGSVPGVSHPFDGFRAGPGWRRFSRRCRPGPSPFRAFPSRAARSPLSGPLHPSPCWSPARPGATSVPWIPRVSPTPTSVRSR